MPRPFFALWFHVATFIYFIMFSILSNGKYACIPILSCIFKNLHYDWVECGGNALAFFSEAFKLWKGFFCCSGKEDKSPLSPSLFFLLFILVKEMTVTHPFVSFFPSAVCIKVPLKWVEGIHGNILPQCSYLYMKIWSNYQLDMYFLLGIYVDISNC